MNEKVLSIVIPTYNMEKYLRRCLDSITLPEILPAVEILVVNDGSKDSSLSIAQSYADKYPGSVKVIDKPNGNYGSCINAALKVASGKYFRILDADDRFNSDNFIRFINKIADVDADMLITNFSKNNIVTGHNEVVVKGTDKIAAETISDFRSFDFEGQGYIYLLAMHAITYRTQLLRDMGYKQTEGISYTDTEYCFYPLAHVNTFIFYNFVLYEYFVGHEGQTISTAAVRKNKEQYYKLSTEMIAYLIGDRKDKDAKILRKQQYAIVQRIASNYYISILIFNPRDEEDNAKLLKMDSDLKKLDGEMYARLSDTAYHGLKFIRAWQEKGIYYSDPKRFRLMKQYLKVRFSLKRSRSLSRIYHSVKK